MDKKLQKQLKEKYPTILKDTDAPVEKSAMAFGITCGDGWYFLLDQLMSSLQWDTDKNKYPQVIATQIKEKFGALRFYYTIKSTKKCTVKDDHYDDYKSGVIGGKIELAEAMSYHICEVCSSAENIVHTKGWVRTLCTKCHKKHFPDSAITEKNNG